MVLSVLKIILRMLTTIIENTVSTVISISKDFYILIKLLLLTQSLFMKIVYICIISIIVFVLYKFFWTSGKMLVLSFIFVLTVAVLILIFF